MIWAVNVSGPAEGWSGKQRGCVSRFAAWEKLTEIAGWQNDGRVEQQPIPLRKIERKRQDNEIDGEATTESTVSHSPLPTILAPHSLTPVG